MAGSPCILIGDDPPDGARSATTDVLAERERQKSIEGWTEAHDDTHATGELAAAAACYARLAGLERIQPPPSWPWAQQWWKPKDRRRDLVRAGALIIAEIERLDRALKRKGERDAK